MASIRVEIKELGFRTMINKFNERLNPARVTELLRDGVQNYFVEPIISRAWSMDVHDTGALKDNTRIGKVSNMTVWFGSYVKYATYVHDGSIHNEPPRPYFRPVVEENKQDFYEFLKEKVLYG